MVIKCKFLTSFWPIEFNWKNGYIIFRHMALIILAAQKKTNDIAHSRPCGNLAFSSLPPHRRGFYFLYYNGLCYNNAQKIGIFQWSVYGKSWFIVKLLCDKRRYKLFSRKVNIIFFVFLLLFGITLMFLQIFAPDWNTQPGILLLYLHFPVLVSILLALIGFQRNIHNEFVKSLFHGYIFLLIFLASLIAIIFHFSPFVFAVFYVYWSILIFLFPVSIVLFFIRKVKSKKYRSMGYAIALIVFVIVFYIFHTTIFHRIMELLGYGFPPLP